jgi:hypothetical protein
MPKHVPEPWYDADHALAGSADGEIKWPARGFSSRTLACFVGAPPGESAGLVYSRANHPNSEIAEDRLAVFESRKLRRFPSAWPQFQPRSWRSCVLG